MVHIFEMLAEYKKMLLYLRCFVIEEIIGPVNKDIVFSNKV